MAETISVIDIVTSGKRHPFTINGETYELLDAGELSLADQMRLANIGDQYARFESLPFGSDEQNALIQQMSETLDWAVRTITRGIPESVFEQLTDMHKTMIVQAFTESFEQGRTHRGESSDQS